MKVNTNFENVADKLFADMQERDYRKKAWDRKKHWGKDSTYSIWERIILVFACFVGTIALICAIIINAHYIDKIPAWGWTLFTLVFIALAVGWMIVRSAKNSLKNPEKDY